MNPESREKYVSALRKNIDWILTDNNFNRMRERVAMIRDGEALEPLDTSNGKQTYRVRFLPKFKQFAVIAEPLGSIQQLFDTHEAALAVAKALRRKGKQL